MKVLFFIDNLGPGGKQRRLVELIKGLLNYPQMEMTLVLTKKEILYTDILNTGIKIYYTIRKLKRDPKVFVDFYRVVQKTKPDLIHVWGNLEAIYSLPAKIILKVPMLNSQITDAPNNFKRTLLNHKLTFPFSDKITANSQAGLKAYNTPKIKGTVIYNGFDFNRIKDLSEETMLRKKLKIKTKYIVGMVASFADRKDYATFMKAINEIVGERKDVTFLCIGDGNFDTYVKMLDNNSIKNVLFLPHQKKVENLMNLCNIGVLTTYTEGISNSLLEYMALGKPLVVAGSGGCKETVIDGFNGFLLESGNFHGLAIKIKRLLDDENLRQTFGKRANEMVKEKFSIEKMVNSFYIEYNKLIS